MLILDRYLGFHFFTNEAGGNMMMFMKPESGPGGHPEGLYPGAAGPSAYSRKWVSNLLEQARCFGYRSMVARHHVDLRHLLHGVAASIFSRWAPDPTVNAILRHRQHDHRSARPA